MAIKKLSTKPTPDEAKALKTYNVLKELTIEDIKKNGFRANYAAITLFVSDYLDVFSRTFKMGVYETIDDFCKMLKEMANESQGKKEMEKS